MNLEKRYYKILNDIKENVKNEKKRRMLTNEINEFVTAAFSGIINLSEMDMFQKSTVIALSEMDDRIKDIENEIFGDKDYNDDEEDDDEESEKYHRKIRETFDEIKDTLSKFSEDEDYHFEMTCPKCHYDFEIQKQDEGKEKISCPKCKKIINLDWSDEKNETSKKSKPKNKKTPKVNLDNYDNIEEDYDNFSNYPFDIVNNVEKANEKDFEYKKDQKDNKTKKVNKDSKNKNKKKGDE